MPRLCCLSTESEWEADVALGQCRVFIAPLHPQFSGECYTQSATQSWLWIPGNLRDQNSGRPPVVFPARCKQTLMTEPSRCKRRKVAECCGGAVIVCPVSVLTRSREGPIPTGLQLTS